MLKIDNDIVEWYPSYSSMRNRIKSIGETLWVENMGRTPGFNDSLYVKFRNGCIKQIANVNAVSWKIMGNKEDIVEWYPKDCLLLLSRQNR